MDEYLGQRLRVKVMKGGPIFRGKQLISALLLRQATRIFPKPLSLPICLNFVDMATDNLHLSLCDQALFTFIHFSIMTLPSRAVCERLSEF